MIHMIQELFGQTLRLRTDNSGNRLPPSGSSLVAANLRLAGLRYVSEFPGAQGFPRFLGKITRRTPVRGYRCALETHQAGRTARRRRRVPIALIQLLRGARVRRVQRRLAKLVATAVQNACVRAQRSKPPSTC